MSSGAWPGPNDKNATVGLYPVERLAGSAEPVALVSLATAMH